MSEKRQTISRANLPQRLPVGFTLAVVVALDHWDAPGWLAVATLMPVAAWWVIVLLGWFGTESLDLIERVSDLTTVVLHRERVESETWPGEVEMKEVKH